MSWNEPMVLCINVILTFFINNINSEIIRNTDRKILWKCACKHGYAKPIDPKYNKQYKKNKKSIIINNVNSKTKYYAKKMFCL